MSQGSQGNPPLRIRLSPEQWAEVRRRAAGEDPATWARRELLGPVLGQPARPGRPPVYHLVRRTDASGAVSWYHCPGPEAVPSWAAVGTPMPPTLAEAVLVLERRRWPGSVVEMVPEGEGGGE